ncbi:MAG: hypothetical protein AAF391_05085 [Bacteroidota bacterium]
MPITLLSASRNEAKNPSGFSRLFIAPASSFISIPGHTNMVVVTDIVMQLSAVFVEVQLDPEASAMVTIESPASEGGTGYVYKPEIFLPGNSPALKAAIESWDGIPLILIGVDKAGIMEIYGEVGRGIRLRANKEDGTKPGTARGYRLSGEQDYNHLPYGYTGTIAT